MTNKINKQEELISFELDILLAEFGTCMQLGIEMEKKGEMRIELLERMSNLSKKIQELIKQRGQIWEEDFKARLAELEQ